MSVWRLHLVRGKTSVSMTPSFCNKRVYSGGYTNLRSMYYGNVSVTSVPLRSRSYSSPYVNPEDTPCTPVSVVPPVLVKGRTGRTYTPWVQTGNEQTDSTTRIDDLPLGLLIYNYISNSLYGNIIRRIST